MRANQLPMTPRAVSLVNASCRNCSLCPFYVVTPARNQVQRLKDNRRVGTRYEKAGQRINVTGTWCDSPCTGTAIVVSKSPGRSEALPSKLI
jgi:hypothetical protein